MSAAVLLGLACALWGLTLSLAVMRAEGALALSLRRGAQGRRGELRRQARLRLWFRVLDGPIVLLGATVQRLRDVPVLRALGLRLVERVRRRLLVAGMPLGLSSDEFLGTTVALSVLLGGLGFYATGAHASGIFGLTAGLVFGAIVPVVRLDSLYAERAKDAMRDIPRAMDLAGLCMSAGMDFTASLRTIVEMDRGTIATELATVLRGLELGLTRRVALFALMERLPCTEVRDFCRAVAQADEKGASLASALSQQARLCRMRRSLRAEENAARAAVLLIGPMMLLLVAILSVLVGPLLIGGVGL